MWEKIRNAGIWAFLAWSIVLLLWHALMLAANDGTLEGLGILP